MNSLRARKIHKSLALAVGAFFLAWLISGIGMVFPRLSAEPIKQAPPLDWQKISVSVHEALAGLAKITGRLPEVKEITAKSIGTATVYQIVTTAGDSHLVDAQSGKLFDFTPEIAGVIARGQVTSNAPILAIELMVRHTVSYPSGPVPAYKVSFGDDPSTSYYVSLRDGTIRRSDRESRIRAAMESVHTLQPVKLLVPRETLRRGMLVLLSLIGVVVVGTGYFLALKRRA